MGLNFECDEKYSYAAMDEDFTFWVYIEEPQVKDEMWDITCDMKQVFPAPTDYLVSSNWKGSKVKI